MSHLVDDFIKKINGETNENLSRFVIPSQGLIDYDMSQLMDNSMQTNCELYSNASKDIITLTTMMSDLISASSDKDNANTVCENISSAMSGFAKAAVIPIKVNGLSLMENTIRLVSDCIMYATQLVHYMEMNFPYVMEKPIEFSADDSAEELINELKADAQRGIENIDIE